MAYELKQELKLTQKLSLTPQLQMAIKLLQLSRHELVEVIGEELEANPVLEDGASEDVSESGVSEESLSTQAELDGGATGAGEEMDWQSYFEDELPARRQTSSPVGSGETLREEADKAHLSLKEHLLSQLRHCELSEKAFEIGEFIIGNIDEDGYLRGISGESGAESDGHEGGGEEDATITEMATILGAEPSEVAEMLRLIQGFDPGGVAARTTAECLMIQAMRLPVRDTLIENIITTHLESLATRNFKAIAKAEGVGVEEVLEAASVISNSLSPMPASGFGSDEARVVIPDVYVRKIEDEYVVMLNDDGLPRLRVSPYYKGMLSNGGTLAGDTKSYVQERFRSALWLIKSVQQRQRTIKRVVESIVRFQREFLDNGIKYLKPLVLREVAEDIEVSESTVSRVTTNKYVHTPRGIFELKYFFSNAVGGEGESASTPEYVKEKIKGIIEGEDPHSPYSDQQISQILKGYDMNVARRTVAKYREELGYFSSGRRKRHM